MKKRRILVVDDDKKTVKLIKLYLEHEGYQVLTAYDGITALQTTEEKKPDLIILDIMLPGLDGIEICTKLREESGVAIIMLTAKTTEEDRLAGLDVGADDYVVKPFSPRELTARVGAVLRRLPDTYYSRDVQIISSGHFQVDLNKLTALFDDIPMQLTPIEFKLLTAMVRAPGQVFSREQLVHTSYGEYYDGYDRTIDVHILNLRKKIELASGSKKYIRTVFGTGYAFDPEGKV